MSRDLPMLWRNTGDTNISLLSAPCWTSVLSYSHEIGPRSPHVPCHIIVQLAVRILRVRWSVPSLFLRKWLVDVYGWACWSEGPHGNRSQTHACVSVCRSLPTVRFCHRPWGPFHKGSYERFLLYEFVEPVLKYRSNEFVALTNLWETGPWAVGSVFT